MNNIVVVGSCMIDFVSYAPKLPQRGETVLGSKFTTGFGGKGANQCAAAAKLGGKTYLVSRLGDDSWGRDYLKTLNDLKIDTKYVQITPDNSSGIAQITVDENGQNQIVVVSGANAILSTNDIDKAAKDISEAGVVVCQLETSVDVALKAIELCEGVSILNGAPALTDYDQRLLTTPTIFCINETEAAVFASQPVDSISDAEKAIENLLNRGCRAIILTLGSQGALYASKENPKPIHISSAKVATVDTTGAGDAFIGALAYLIAEYPKFSMEKRIQVACKMAAYSVTKRGTQISFPDSIYFQQCLKENKY